MYNITYVINTFIHNSSGQDCFQLAIRFVLGPFWQKCGEYIIYLLILLQNKKFVVQFIRNLCKWIIILWSDCQRLASWNNGSLHSAHWFNIYWTSWCNWRWLDTCYFNWEKRASIISGKRSKIIIVCVCVCRVIN